MGYRALRAEPPVSISAVEAASEPDPPDLSQTSGPEASLHRFHYSLAGQSWTRMVGQFWMPIHMCGARSRWRAWEGDAPGDPGQSWPRDMDFLLVPRVDGFLRIRHCGRTSEPAERALCAVSGAFLRPCRGVWPWRQSCSSVSTGSDGLRGRPSYTHNGDRTLVLSPQQPCPRMAMKLRFCLHERARRERPRARSTEWYKGGSESQCFRRNRDPRAAVCGAPRARKAA